MGLRNGGKTNAIWCFLSLPLLNYEILLSQIFSLAQSNGNSAPSWAVDEMKRERMTEGCVGTDGAGPTPSPPG